MSQDAGTTAITDGMALPDAVKDALGDFAGKEFDALDIENARLDNATPERIAKFEAKYGFTPDMMTSNNKISVNPNSKINLASPRGVSLLAHELTHVKQFRTGSAAGYGRRFQQLLAVNGGNAIAAYYNHPLERSAYSIQGQVFRALSSP